MRVGCLKKSGWLVDLAPPLLRNAQYIALV